MRRLSRDQEYLAFRVIHALRILGIIAGILLFGVIAFGLFYFVLRMSNPSIPPLPIGQPESIELEPQVIEAEAVRQIEINCSSTAVTVKPSGKEQPQATIRIEESYEEDDYNHSPSEWSITGGVLHIESTDGGHTFRDAKRTVITVSPDILAQLEKTTITCQTGDVYLIDLTSNVVNVEMGAGGITIDDVIAPSLKLGVTSGKAVVDGTFGTVDLFVSSGNADLIVDGTPSRISCSVQSGEAIIALPKKLGFTARTSVGAGEVTFDQKVEKLADGSVVYGDGSLQLNASVTSGTIRVTRSN